MHVTEPSKSECVARTELAVKKDGLLRFCAYHQNLTAVPFKYSDPFPKKEECINSLADAQVFLILDESSGYWHFEVDRIF